MTLQQLNNLTVGMILHQHTARNADGSYRRWKITSVKRWKRDPGRFQIGLKNGMRHYETLTTTYHLTEVHLTIDEATAAEVADRLNPPFTVSPGMALLA